MKTRVKWSVRELCLWLLGALAIFTGMASGALLCGLAAFRTQDHWMISMPLVVVASAALYRMPSVIFDIFDLFSEMLEAVRERRW